ncbi:MAG: bifunctional 3,4-dihydroxy-2-butanone-4-phosphate synthase/GTP cyclohydrolase II, partial [Deltaproteobacteria bacterium]|nr:bifunctional 3,4-dihydroxy-2-butanone-4-phosphate synthase/GTP cyclohydrolase II [Deltaproteobacteria bacterium]
EAREARNFRDFGIGAQILRDLGIRKLKLVTNNPRNLVGLSGYGLEVTSSVPFPMPPGTIRRGAAGG